MIQALSSSSLGPRSISIPIGLYAGKEGTYTFSINRHENLDKANISIEDMNGKKKTMFKNGNTYSVYLKAGEYNNRFILKYQLPGNSREATSTELERLNVADIYTIGNSIVLKTDENAEVYIFDMLGKLVKQDKINAEETSVITIDNASGFYIVRLKYSDAEVSGKVFLR